MENIEDRIRRRAYEIWEQEGRPDGREVDHWLRAAREIADEEGRGEGMAAAAASAPAVSAPTASTPTASTPTASTPTAGARKPAARARKTGAKEPSAQLAQPAASARAEQSVERPSGGAAGEPGAKPAARRGTVAKAATAPAASRTRRPGEGG